MRIHTFGVGNEVNQALLKEIGLAGRGSYNYTNENINNLKGQVINALKWSMEPSLSNCILEWSGR